MKRALIACVLAGCGTTDIDRDVCGNGLVEPGEDCDSVDPRCQACGVKCESGLTEECLEYDPAGMAGFVCGPDRFCHAPSGAFQPVFAFAMPAELYRVTDVNGDGFGDLLVQSQTSVTAVFDASTAAANAVSIQTPIPRGNAAFALVDDDGSLDTLIPTTDGIVAYTTRFGVPSPYPFPSPISLSTGDPIFVHTIKNTLGHLGVMGSFPGNDLLFYAVLDGGQLPPKFIGQAGLCDARVGDVDTSEVQVFETGAQHLMVALTLRPPGQPAKTCILTVDRNGAEYDVVPVAFTPTAEPTSRPVLADLRGQPCPSLILAQGGGQLVEYKPAAVANPCTFDTTATPVVNAPAGAVPIGTVPLVPAVLGRTVGLALSTGIYNSVAGGSLSLSEMYRSDRVLQNVQATDLDGDGDVDVVATGKSSEDLDILDRKLPAGFLRFRFATDAPVGQFMIGDFDGNELPDVAYIERGLGEDRLQIAYGTTDRLLPGVNVGTFAKVLSTMLTSIPDSTDPDRLIDDAAVLFEAPVLDPTTFEVTFQPALTLLHGSPQRTMLAFFDPRTPPLAPQSQFRGVVAGFFRADSNGNDVLAIEQSGPLTRVYLSIGATNGELQSQNANDASNIADCNGSGDPADGSLCIDDAHFLAWSVGASHDVIVAIDTNLQVASFDPRSLAGNAPITMTRWVDTIVAPPRSAVRKVQRVELGDGAPRLLISLGAALDAPDPRTAGAVNLCTFDDVTGPVCEDLTARVPLLFGPQVCIDAGVARVAPASRFNPPDTESPDLVLLCRSEGFDSLFRVSFEGVEIRSVDLIDITIADTIQIGDVSGDGVDDLVLLDRSQTIPIMTVYRQCNSRDTGCVVSTTVGEDMRQ